MSWHHSEVWQAKSKTITVKKDTYAIATESVYLIGLFELVAPIQDCNDTQGRIAEQKTQ